MPRPSQVVVLAEDRCHQRFVQRYLERLGYGRHDIRLVDLPSGRGCGEQWVRERYPQEVRAYRSRSARAQSALIVAIDADSGDVERRLRQLREALTQAEMPPRRDEESIVHLIARRNIETWILCLDGENSDEETDYRREPSINERIAGAAGTLYQWSRPNFVPPPRCVPSLLSAIPEIKRLDE